MIAFFLLVAKVNENLQSAKRMSIKSALNECYFSYLYLHTLQS